MMRFPLIVAHAGCENTPAHTAASVLAGLRAGADMVEIDLRLTRDGVPVLYHEAYLDAAPAPVRLRDLSYLELSDLARQGRILLPPAEGRLTRLEEILDIVKSFDKAINLDIKEDEVIGPTLAAVKKAGMQESVILSGCERDRACYVKDQYRGFQVLLNASLGRGDYRGAVRKICREAVACSCCGVNMHYQECTEELVEYARTRFLPVSIWTVDDEADMERVTRMGIQAVATNQVAVMMRIKRDRIKKP